MKVSEAIKSLTQYDPDEEIILAYWDKEFIADYMGLAMGEKLEDTNLDPQKLMAYLHDHVSIELSEGEVEYWVAKFKEKLQ